MFTLSIELLQIQNYSLSQTKHAGDNISNRICNIKAYRKLFEMISGINGIVA